MTNNPLGRIFGDQQLDIDCPQCNASFHVKLKDVMQDRSVVRCPECKTDIKLIHDDTTKRTLRDSERAAKDFEKSLDDLERAFKNFGK